MTASATASKRKEERVKMSDLFESVIAKISSQQSGLDEYDQVYQVGEQLKEIACESESNAELVLKDLDNPEMSIESAEKLIENFASAHRKGNKGCTPLKVADKILRDLYGLPPKDSKPQTPAEPGIISLESFM